jgi:hypothetical protein
MSYALVRRGVCAAVAAVVVIAVGALFVRRPWESRRDPFPSVATAGMSPTQLRILDVLRREYGVNPPGEKYSGGVSEPWCADFVSWVLDQAGEPLSNPNSGAWRIPGVATLQDYYQSVGRFSPPGDYTPKFGDVIMYAPDDRLWRQHTQFVLADSGGELTTLGGNQPGGITLGRTPDDDGGIIGFGRN